jgi:hypothetical protein
LLNKKIKISFYLTESIRSQLPRQTVEKNIIKSKTHTKSINTLFRNNVEFLNIKVINSDGVKLTGHEGRKRNEKVHKTLNSKRERDRTFGRSSYSWENNIKFILNIQDVRM